MVDLGIRILCIVVDLLLTLFFDMIDLLVKLFFVMVALCWGLLFVLMCNDDHALLGCSVVVCVPLVILL